MSKFPNTPKVLITARVQAGLRNKLLQLSKIRGKGLSETVETAIILGLHKNTYLFESELKRIVKEGGVKGLVARFLAYLLRRGGQK